MKNLLILALAMAATANTSYATEYQEVEPNETLETANAFLDLQPGDTIVGQAVQPERDYYRLGARNLEAGKVFMHTISAIGNNFRTREEVEQGFNGTPLVMGSSGPVVRQAWNLTDGQFIKNKWFSIGTESEVSYLMRDRGPVTTVFHSIGYDRQEVAAPSLGAFQAGDVTFAQRSTGLVDGWLLVYRADGQLVGGARNEALQPFRISLQLVPGTYFLAFSGEGTLYSSTDFLPSRNLIGRNAMLNDQAFSTFSTAAPIEVSDGTALVTYDPRPDMQAANPYGLAFRSITVVPEPRETAGLGLMAGVVVTAGLLKRR